MSDLQLPMFDDLRFWSATDLEEYIAQCESDIFSLSEWSDVNWHEEHKTEEAAQGIRVLREEIDACKRELAYRSMLR